MAKKHKFAKGPPVEGIISAVAQINSGQWMYFHDKPLSPKWLGNWSLVQIMSAVKHRSLFYATPTKE